MRWASVDVCRWFRTELMSLDDDLWPEQHEAAIEWLLEDWRSENQESDARIASQGATSSTSRGSGAGCQGHCVVPDEDDIAGMAAEMGIVSFGQWIGAIQRTFGSDDNAFDKSWMLEHYDTLDRATELWDCGDIS